MRQTTRTPRNKNAVARTPLDMDISALLRSAQLLEKAANELSQMDHDSKASSEFDEALRHNRQIWSVLMGDSNRTGIAVNPIIQQNVPALGSQVLAETRHLETERSSASIEKLVSLNRHLASNLQRSKAA